MATKWTAERRAKFLKTVKAKSKGRRKSRSNGSAEGYLTAAVEEIELILKKGGTPDRAHVQTILALVATVRR